MKTKLFSIMFAVFFLFLTGCASSNNNSESVSLEDIDVKKTDVQEKKVEKTEKIDKTKKNDVEKEVSQTVIVSAEDAAVKKAAEEVALATQSRYGENKAKKACQKVDQKYVKKSQYMVNPNVVCVEEH